MTNQDYETRVRALEAQGAIRSDAQSVVDAEILREKTTRPRKQIIRQQALDLPAPPMPRD